ncbi:DnaB-like helicase C-terminal domain-containing protein [Anaeromyxobacter dehalogenans]|uniref:DnaB-like helicase C-terminal domain-containing protein n=1 Tax=Anaeromyxobacter dehalogenans TaxID=161493 RepID=UPI0012ED9B33|nr:DnaB-like helicase C-terminal domain-containing protein [Anaeromyxobacter dehalogenans]
MGAGLTRPRGHRLQVVDVADLARVLGEQPADVDGWWSPHVWRGDTRDGAAWQAACAVALDMDRDGHAALPDELARRLEEAAADGSLPGSIFHRTPAGARVVFALAEPCSDRDAFDRAAAGAAQALAAQLRELDITGIGVDPKPHRDLARLYYTPNAIAKGVRRQAAVLVMRRAPYSVEQLAALREADEPPAAPAAVQPPRAGATGAVRRARAWLAKKEPAVQGEHGDDQTFRAAAALVRDFDLDDEDALALLLEWNQGCSPPWTEQELRGKLRSARRNGKHAPGAKLAESPPRSAQPEAGASITPAAPAPFSIASVLDEQESRLERGTERIATGWTRLDAALGGGLAVPSLVVLGAPPKAGKSSWSQILAVRHVEAGGVAYVLDLENGPRRVLRQIMCRRAEVGPGEAARALADRRTGVFTSREAVERWNAAKAWLRTTLGPSLFLECTPPADLEARVAGVRQVAGDRKLLLVVDSLQKLPGDPRDDRRTTIDKWIRTFERLRYQFDATILVISEIRRGREGYAAREDAFKESGGIEYGCDLAMTLNRPAADEDTEAPATLRVELARDTEEDPRGEVASYRAVRPWYGLEEVDPVPLSKGRRGGRGPEPVKAEAAREFLRQRLAAGPARVSEVLGDGRAAGFSESTLRRAGRELGLASCTVQLKTGWRLP